MAKSHGFFEELIPTCEAARFLAPNLTGDASSFLSDKARGRKRCCDYDIPFTRIGQNRYYRRRDLLAAIEHIRPTRATHRVIKKVSFDPAPIIEGKVLSGEPAVEVRIGKQALTLTPVEADTLGHLLVSEAKKARVLGVLKRVPLLGSLKLSA